MRTSAGVRLDEADSNIDAATVYFDLFGNMFIDQGIGQTVALSPAMQDQLVDAILERHTVAEKPKRATGKVVSLGMVMSMAFVMAAPGPLWYHCKVKRANMGSPNLTTVQLNVRM